MNRYKLKTYSKIIFKNDIVSTGGGMVVHGQVVVPHTSRVAGLNPTSYLCVEFAYSTQFPPTMHGDALRLVKLTTVSDCVCAL